MNRIMLRDKRVWFLAGGVLLVFVLALALRHDTYRVTQSEKRDRMDYFVDFNQKPSSVRLIAIARELIARDRSGKQVAVTFLVIDGPFGIPFARYANGRLTSLPPPKSLL